MTTDRDRSPSQRNWLRFLPALQEPGFAGLDRGGLITGVLGLLLGGLYLIPNAFEGRAVSLEPVGQIPCASVRGQPMGTCGVLLQRPGQGKTSLQVSHPNGMKRELVFRDGTFTGCQLGREGCGELTVQVAKEDQLRLLRVGKERYEIPGSLLLGK
ncbi:MAG: hypothetical protein ACKO28_05525 [Cyanobium sp.]|jgi:hypothetical protein